MAVLAVRPTARTLAWAAFAPVVAVASVVVASGSRRGADPLAFHLPVAGLLLAAWLGFQFADGAGLTVAASPTSLLRRRALRLGIALPVVVVAWAGLCVQAGTGSRTLPLCVLFASASCVAAGAASAGERLLGPGRGGPTAVATLFLVFAVGPAVLRIPWTVGPALAGHRPLGRWLGTAAVGLAVFVGAALDPARRRRADV